MNTNGQGRTVISQPVSLTQSEVEILELLAEGLSNGEIAGRLALTAGSLYWHMQQIYGKLGVNGKRQAIQRSGELGIIRRADAPAALSPAASADLFKPEQKLPTGNVTFLFTDIEGSTPRWEKTPDAMRVAVALHHAVLRAGIEANGGSVFKIIGDAFQASFVLTRDGLSAAIEIQHQLAGVTWPKETGMIKVRMGLHTGPAFLDEHGDYAVSHTLNRVARVMSAGHGGQILLSQETKDLLERSLPEGVLIKDLGEHRMKGLSVPEHLYQVTAPGLCEAFPPLATALQHPHNLPPELTSFIGRESLIAELKELLMQGAQRLVSLTGAGGTGKTRLALQVGKAMLEVFQDGVWLVELAPLSDPELVTGALVQALSVREVAGKTLQETLAAAIEKKHLLLILDNCEHLVEECARLVDFLLRRCPQLVVLATSREILSLMGETSFCIPSLSLPDPALPHSLEQIASSEAVQLFIERTRQVVPSFVLDETNVGAAALICQRLDGVPLAIELAAARMRMMTAAQIAARLDDVFRLLTGGSRNVLPRHQTLKAAIDWSYTLLTPVERLLMQRLSVFAGGWNLEAAEAVCAGEGIEASEVLDLVGEMVDKSLAQPYQVEGGELRYRMLEAVRQYARDRLLEAGEREATRDRHLAYYLNLCSRAAHDIKARKKFEWVNRLGYEIENLRLALEWSWSDDIKGGVRATQQAVDDFENMGDLLEQMGRHEESRKAYTGALERVAEEDRICRARIIRKTGRTWEVQSQFEKVTSTYDQAEAILGEARDDPEWRSEWIDIMNARVYFYYWATRIKEMQEVDQRLGPVVIQYGSPFQKYAYWVNKLYLGFKQERYLFSKETIRLAEQLVSISSDLDDSSLRANAYFELGFSTLWSETKWQESIAPLQEAVKLADKVGDRVLLLRSLIYLIMCYRRLGDITRVESLAPRCLEVSEQVQMFEYTGATYAHLSWARWKQCDLARYERDHQAAYHAWDRINSRHASRYVFEFLVLLPAVAVALSRGEIQKAVECARVMLEPDRKRFESDLAEAMAQSVAAGQAGQLSEARAALAKTVELAMKYCYL